MNNRVKLLLLLWGGVAAILIAVAIIWNILNPSSPADTVPDGTDYGDVQLSLLSSEEQSSISKTTTDLLREFFTQDTAETAAARSARLAPMLSNNSTVSRRSLLVGNTYTSHYTIITQVSASVGQVTWSNVTPTTAVVYATVTTTLRDAAGFQETTAQNWFVHFQKDNSRWLVANLEEWPTPPTTIE